MESAQVPESLKIEEIIMCRNDKVIALRDAFAGQPLTPNGGKITWYDLPESLP